MPKSCIMFDHQAHVDMWDWLSKNPDKQKLDWPGWKDIPVKPMYSCMACGFAARISPTGSIYPNRCKYCPLEWPDGGLCADTTEQALHDRWFETENLEERAELAARIRDLPLREFAKTPDTFPDFYSALHSLFTHYDAMDKSYEKFTLYSFVDRTLPLYVIYDLYRLNRMIISGDTVELRPSERYLYTVTALGITIHSTEEPKKVELLGLGE